MYNPEDISTTIDNRLKCHYCKNKIFKGQEFIYHEFSNICNLCIRKFSKKLNRKNLKEAEAVRIADKL